MPTPTTTVRTARDAVSPARVAELTGLIRSTTGETRTTTSPLTGEPVAEIPKSSIDDVEAAFDAARAAQLTWSQTSLRERRRALLRLHDLVLERREELLDLIQLESGKARIPRVRRDRPRRAHRALLRATAPTPAEARASLRRAAGAHLGSGQPRAQRRRRHHQPLELPAHDGHLRRTARHRRRQHRRAQAGQPEPVDRPGRHRADAGRRVPTRRVAGRQRRRLGGGHRDHRARRLHLFHRLHGHRLADRAAGRRPAGQLLARARRQEPDDRAARRERREDRGRRRERLLLLRRPAVRLDRAALRARQPLRRVP